MWEEWGRVRMLVAGMLELMDGRMLELEWGRGGAVGQGWRAAPR